MIKSATDAGCLPFIFSTNVSGSPISVFSSAESAVFSEASDASDNSAASPAGCAASARNAFSTASRIFEATSFSNRASSRNTAGSIPVFCSTLSSSSVSFIPCNLIYRGIHSSSSDVHITSQRAASILSGRFISASPDAVCGANAVKLNEIVSTRSKYSLLRLFTSPLSLRQQSKSDS